MDGWIWTTNQKVQKVVNSLSQTPRDLPTCVIVPPAVLDFAVHVLIQMFPKVDRPHTLGCPRNDPSSQYRQQYCTGSNASSTVQRSTRCLVCLALEIASLSHRVSRFDGILSCVTSGNHSCESDTRNGRNTPPPQQQPVVSPCCCWCCCCKCVSLYMWVVGLYQ